MDHEVKSGVQRIHSSIEMQAQPSDVDGVQWMTCSKGVDNSDDEIRPRLVHRLPNRLVHMRIT